MNRKPSFATPEKYAGPAITLHWLIALLIICGFYIGWVMVHIHGITPTKLRLVSYHKWIGVTVFMLVLLRVLWRATHRPPPLPRQMPAWQRGLAHAVHGALYVLIVAIPVSGYLFSSAQGVQVVYLGVLPLPPLIGPDKALRAVLHTIHVYLNWALFWIVALHVLGALKHQLIDRDGLLARMLPFGRPK
jgi:cytochrome b561